ncbi:MAG: hypothetical protein K8T20_15395 [Planctomycetes bacterium]|nr:hypothetical protein [Planctomycetota bacterium]
MNATLRTRLDAWEKRLRRQVAVRSAVLGTFAGTAVAAGYVLGAKWFHWPHAWETAVGISIAVPVIAFAVRMLRPIPLADVARAADRAAGTSDRFATALELQGTEWAELVERDAAATSLPGEKELFATHLPRVSRWSFVAAAALAAMLFFIPSRYVPAVTPLASDLKGLEAPPELATAADDLRKMAAEDGDPELAELAKELERIDQAWKEGKIDKKEALAQIGEVREKIREAKEKSAARKEALAKLAEAEASHELGHRTSTGEGADAAEAAAAKLGKDAGEDGKMADALDNAANAAAADKKLSDALKKSADAARRGDKKAFTEGMKKARERWNGLAKKGAEAARKDAAAKAAKGEDPGKKSKALDPALLKELEKALAKSGLNDKALQEALDRLAKASKDPGKPGEAGEFDNEKLRAMIEKLKKMDPAELKELAEKLKKMSDKEIEELAKKMAEAAKCAGGS